MWRLEFKIGKKGVCVRVREREIGCSLSISDASVTEQLKAAWVLSLLLSTDGDRS